MVPGNRQLSFETKQELVSETELSVDGSVRLEFTHGAVHSLYLIAVTFCDEQY